MVSVFSSVRGTDMTEAGVVIAVYTAIPAQAITPPSNKIPDTTSAGPGAGVSANEILAAAAK